MIKNEKLKKCQKKFDFFEFFFDDIFESRKFSKKSSFFFDHFLTFQLFQLLDFQLFQLFFSHRKKMFFGNFFIFYVFIISHALPTQVVSRKSPCAAHKRGKRIPEYRENQENHRKSRKYHFCEKQVSSKICVLFIIIVLALWCRNHYFDVFSLLTFFKRNHGLRRTYQTDGLDG